MLKGNEAVMRLSVRSEEEYEIRSKMIGKRKEIVKVALEERKRDKIIDAGVFCILLIIVSVMMLALCYWQTTGGETGYWSDMRAYILKMQGLDSGYKGQDVSYPYPVFFKISAFLNLFTEPEMAVALATMFLNTLGMILMKIAFNRIALDAVRSALPHKKWLSGIVLSVVCFSLFYASMVYPPKGIYLPGIKYNYLGVFTPNPFHNATYLAARPFTILVFFWFAKLLPVYEEGYSGRWKAAEKGVALWDYILFAVFLLVATMTKPSFTLVLVGTAGVIMAYRLIRARLRNLIPTLQLGTCFLPTFVDLLYQYKGVFVPEPGEEGGVGFGLAAAWKHHCDNIPLAIGLAMGFPVLVLLLNYKELKRDMVYRFSWQLFGMSLAMTLLLYEKGFRMVDMNFAWGYMHGIFFAFVGALLVLIRSTASRNKPVFLLVAQWIAYGWHLVCGIVYFVGIYGGELYY